MPLWPESGSESENGRRQALKKGMEWGGVGEVGVGGWGQGVGLGRPLQVLWLFLSELGGHYRGWKSEGICFELY